jgi:hypothetical protein
MKRKLIYLLLAGVLLLTACGESDAEATPTIDAIQVQTQAIETFSAALTQTAFAVPTKITPFPTLTASATFAPFATPAGTQPTLPQAGVPSTASCYQMQFLRDVTIPDNTQMTPGQAFTKTWRVKNTGSCAWDAGFKFAFVSGESMNGAVFTIPASVAAGAETDISVAMVAPTNKTGALRGNWRMQTAGGQFFGDEVYVIIVVGGTASTNTSAAPTNTSAAPTNTTAPPTSTTAPPTNTPPTP